MSDNWNQTQVLSLRTLWAPPRSQLSLFGHTTLELFSRQESEFLRHVVSDLKELEPKGEGCTKVYVWHTRTEKVNLAQEQKRKTMNLPPSDSNMEV